MSIRAYAGLVAGILMIIGVIGLFSGVTATVSGRNIECGSAISSKAADASMQGAGRDVAGAMYGGSDSDYSTRYQVACESAVGSQRAWTLPVTGLGIVTGVAAIAVYARRQPANPA